MRWTSESPGGDANSNMLTEEYDFDADGTANGRTTYTYDANGNMLCRLQVDEER